ncbi:MAG: tol-pal system-associated acyl-CoA thioesterase [Gammaproteobacteria bacterium]|mgnify:CR=1 FL=1|nr:MAG: tol-pal system-associated acyl-CoA thioesterase [Gammaproteobacteria bacterium]
MTNKSELEIRVYYEDTDTLGMVYHANYLKFFERGRSEHVRSKGYNQSDLFSELGLLFSVRKMNIDFIKPAQFEQVLIIETEITVAKGARLVFNQQARCKNSSEIYCKAEVKIACVDKETGKPTRLPEKFITEIVNA